MPILCNSVLTNQYVDPKLRNCFVTSSKWAPELLRTTRLTILPSYCSKHPNIFGKRNDSLQMIINYISGSNSSRNVVALVGSAHIKSTVHHKITISY